jgi:DNA-binding GntR family transcriptional regulator
MERDVSDSGARKRGRPRKPASLGANLGGSGDQLRLRRASLHERAVARLRQLIIRGQLAQGTELVEAELCAAIGVSRTPLREALKLLAAGGLVELRPNRSARVAQMQRGELIDLFETLSGLERHAAELAAERMTADDLAALARMQETMEGHFRAAEIDAYFELNHAIHLAIVAAARNPLLQQTHHGLMTRAEWARYAALGSQRRWDESIAEHRAILAALVGRDGADAGRLLARHVMATGLEVVQALAPERAARATDDAA